MSDTITLSFDDETFNKIKVNITTSELEKMWQRIRDELNKRYTTKTILDNN